MLSVEGRSGEWVRGENERGKMIGQDASRSLWVETDRQYYLPTDAEMLVSKIWLRLRRFSR
jgi:hypothetical protein